MLRTITECCTTICPYPTYGHECKGLCRCDEDMCDVSNRCEPKTTGKYVPIVFLQDCIVSKYI